MITHKCHCADLLFELNEFQFNFKKVCCEACNLVLNVSKIRSLCNQLTEQYEGGLTAH